MHPFVFSFACFLSGGALGASAVAAVRWQRSWRAWRAAQRQGDSLEVTPLLRTLADHAFDAVFVKDHEGRYVLFNKAAAQLMKVEGHTMLGRTDESLFPNQLQSIRARDRQVIDTAQVQTFEQTLDTPEGARTLLTTKGPWHDGDGRHGLFGVARDITAIAATREQLRRSEQRFRLAAAGGDVWDWDIEHGTSAVQSNFWRRLGHTEPTDAQAFERLAALIHPEDRPGWQEALRAHLRQRKPYHVEFRAQHRNGHWLWFRTQGQAMWNEQGRAIYMAGTTYDVTQRREAEQAVAQARSELSQLTQRLMDQERETTTRIAHSLHDQLGQILGGARLHLDMALNHVQGVSHASRQRLDRVSSLVDYAIEEVRRVLTALRPPLLEDQGLYAALDNELRRGAAHELGLKVVLIADDSTQLTRWPAAVEHAAFMVAREALSNALKHAHAQRVEVFLCGDGGTLELAVCDDGVGLANAVLHGRPGHLGMVGMRERAAAIGGLFTVQRSLTGGTTVKLSWQEPSHG
jgi:PAS domain S-box-containing protein